MGITKPISKTAIRQALRFRHKLSYSRIARLTNTTRQAVRMTVDPRRIEQRGGKPWTERSTQERGRAIRAAEKLIPRALAHMKPDWETE